jgi:hypothetical protein
MLLHEVEELGAKRIKNDREQLMLIKKKVFSVVLARARRRKSSWLLQEAEREVPLVPVLKVFDILVLK